MSTSNVELKIDFYKSGAHDAASQWAGKNNTSLHKAAVAIFSAATGGDVHLSFDNNEMIVNLPKKYVEEAKKHYNNTDLIIQECIKTGLRRLGA